MPVNFLNLPGLDVVDFRETDTEYHVRATPEVGWKKWSPTDRVI